MTTITRKLYLQASFFDGVPTMWTISDMEFTHMQTVKETEITMEIPEITFPEEGEVASLLERKQVVLDEKNRELADIDNQIKSFTVEEGKQ